MPLSITTDGAPGLTKAVEAMWSESLRIRCWAHKTRNVLESLLLLLSAAAPGA